jgi:hypothetical protein
MGSFFELQTKKRDLPFRAARAGLARKIVVREGLAPIHAALRRISVRAKSVKLA